MLQAAENLKAAEDMKQIMDAAAKKHAEAVNESEADKAAQKANGRQLGLLKAELATARKELKVRLTL